VIDVMSRKAQLYLTIICVLIGVLVVTQYRTHGKIAKALVAESSQEQAAIISSLYDANSELRQEVARLTLQLEQNRSAMPGSDLDAMVSELNRLRIVSGVSAVSGPGIQLSIAGPLRAEDIMDMVNELRNAGAEAIAVNEQRIVANSFFSNSPEGISVSGVTIAQPYVFSAIGHPDTLEKAIERKGGLLTIIENSHPEAIVTLEKRDRLVLPPCKVTYEWKYAQVAK